MMTKRNEKIKQRLSVAYGRNQGSSNGVIGRCNDEVLFMLIKKIRRDPSPDSFIAFVQTLNFYYSTRLQLGKAGRNKTVILAAKILQENWFEGCELYKITRNKRVDIRKVENFRKIINTRLGNNFYSFTTKVFHLLNPLYPIIDNTVKQFLKEFNFSKRINFSSETRSYGLFYDHFKKMMNAIEWENSNVDTLDTAIWQFISDRNRRRERREENAA